MLFNTKNEPPEFSGGSRFEKIVCFQFMQKNYLSDVMKLT